MDWIIVIVILILIWVGYEIYKSHKKEKKEKAEKVEEPLDLTETQEEIILDEDQNEKEVNHEEEPKQL